MMKNLRILPLALCLFASAAAQAVRGPAETVSSFYKLRIESGSNGTPSGRDLAGFSSYLAPELVCLLGASLRYRDQFSKTLPDRPLPLSEGDLYSSRLEGPTRFTLGAADGSRIPVHFYHGESDEKGWEDVVKLTQVRGRWLISDVEYQSPSGQSGSLVARLRATLSHPEAASKWDARELESCVILPRHERSADAGDGKHGKHGKKHARKGSKSEKSAKASHSRKGEKASRSHERKASAKDSAKSKSHARTTEKKTSRSSDKRKHSGGSKSHRKH